VEEVSIVGLDLAKHVFQVHGAGPDGSVAIRRKLPRSKVLSFFAAQPRLQAPGVGPLVALTYAAGVDDPSRFRGSRTVGAHFGLTPRRFQSGEMDWSGGISRAGDARHSPDRQGLVPTFCSSVDWFACPTTDSWWREPPDPGRRAEPVSPRWALPTPETLLPGRSSVNWGTWRVPKSQPQSAPARGALATPGETALGEPQPATRMVA
jgi:hypothetical protein